MSPAGWLIPLFRCPETGLGIRDNHGVLTRADGAVLPSVDGIASFVAPESLGGLDAAMNRRYQQIAPFYDFGERVLGWLLTGADVVVGRREMVALSGLKAGMRLLEVSPGPGVFQPLLRAAVGSHAEFVALDLSSNMLRQCRERFADLRI